MLPPRGFTVFELCTILKTPDWAVWPGSVRRGLGFVSAGLVVGSIGRFLGNEREL